MLMLCGAIFDCDVMIYYALTYYMLCYAISFLTHRPFDSKKIKAVQRSPLNLPLRCLEQAPLSAACKSFVAKLLCTQVRKNELIIAAYHTISYYAIMLRYIVSYLSYAPCQTVAHDMISYISYITLYCIIRYPII